MNLSGGVLVRSVLEWSERDCETISNSVSMQFIPGMKVVQKWSAVKIDADDFEDGDEPDEEHIHVHRMVYLDREVYLLDDARSSGPLTKSGKTFRRFSADERMPRPPHAIVRAMALGEEAPTETDALRSEISKLQDQLDHSRVMESFYKKRMNHLLGDLSWDLATADNPMPDDDA